MKEIEVHSWCDWDHPTRVPADIEVQVSINGSKARVLDLCADHDLLLAALFQQGASVTDIPEPRAARAGGRRPMPGPHLCPICDSEHASRNAMTKHLRSAHQTSIKELAERGQG